LTVELQKKEILAKKPIDPNEMYNGSQLTDLDIEPLNLSFNVPENVVQDNITTDLLKIRNRTDPVSKIIDNYRLYMKCLDYIATILILIGAVFSQYENELYYYHNIKYRVVATLLMNSIFKNNTNHSLESTLSEVNLHDLVDYKTPANYSEIIQDLNISYINYSEDLTDYSKINIYLEIPEASNILRHFILYSTFGSGNLV
jgi:hypothetical protein